MKFQFHSLISILTTCFDFLKNSEPLTQFKIYFMTQFSLTVPGVSPYPRCPQVTDAPGLFLCPWFLLKFAVTCFYLRPSASNYNFCAPGFRVWEDIISYCGEQRLGWPNTPRPSAQIFNNGGVPDFEWSICHAIICAVSYMLCPCREQAWSGIWAPWTILNVSKAKNMTENIILDSFQTFSSGFRSKKYFCSGRSMLGMKRRTNVKIV